MKRILYMASTINGLIARENDGTDFISKKEWNFYSAMVRKSGALIIGRRTYLILTKQPEFKEFEKVKIVVISRSLRHTLSPLHLIATSTKASLALLKDFKEVIVAGGGILNTSFMKNNLIDEIYLDVEPLALGKGIPLFRGQNFETTLQFLGMKKISANEIQLHYKVKK